MATGRKQYSYKGAKLDPKFNFAEPKHSGILTKPFSPPQSLRIDPLIPYTDLSSSLTFTYTVPACSFFRFAPVGCYLQATIDKGTVVPAVAATATTAAVPASVTWAPVAPGDRAYLLAPQAIIKSVKVNMNSCSLPLLYPTEKALSRLINLSLRSTSSQYDDLTALNDSLFVPYTAEDKAKSADDETVELKKLLNITGKQGKGSSFYGIPLPFFPFGTMPVHCQLYGENKPLSSSRVFPEHTQLTISMGVSSAKEMEDYILQCKVKSNNDTVEKFRLRIENIFLMGELWPLTVENQLVKSFRDFCKSSRLPYPLLHCTESDFDLTHGSQESIVNFRVSSFDSRFLIIFIKDQNDDKATTRKPINVTDFTFPSALKRLSITCGGENIASTPVDNLNGTFSDHTKIQFFLGAKSIS